MTALKMAFYRDSGRRMVEVYDDDGEFIASIYPTGDGSNSIHIVSKYFADDPIKLSVGTVPVPGYLVQFKEKR
jgi:hypothetical protein